MSRFHVLRLPRRRIMSRYCLKACASLTATTGVQARMANYKPDADDRRVVSYDLKRPYRLQSLTVLADKLGEDSQQVVINEIHTFLWLEQQYFKYKAAPIRLQTRRLLTDWLRIAEFDKEAIH